MTTIPGTVSLLRRPDVETRTGLSRSEIYRRVKDGSFPPPIALGAQAVAWPSSDIDAWIAERIRHARATPAASP